MKQTAFLAANAASAARQLGLTSSSSSSSEAGLPPASSSKKKASKQQQQQQQQGLEQRLRSSLDQFGLLGDGQAAVAAALKQRSSLLAAAADGDKQAQQQLQQELPLMGRWGSKSELVVLGFGTMQLTPVVCR
jgi:hypothetical protein